VPPEELPDHLTAKWDPYKKLTASAKQGGTLRKPTVWHRVTLVWSSFT